jgi:hypothetical protein
MFKVNIPKDAARSGLSCYINRRLKNKRSIVIKTVGEIQLAPTGLE